MLWFCIDGQIWVLYDVLLSSLFCSHFMSEWICLTPCVNIAGFPDSNISSNSSFVVVRPAVKKKKHLNVHIIFFSYSLTMEKLTFTAIIVSAISTGSYNCKNSEYLTSILKIKTFLKRLSWLWLLLRVFALEQSKHKHNALLCLFLRRKHLKIRQETCFFLVQFWGIYFIIIFNG